MSKQFTSAVRRGEPLEFEIDGDTFHFTAPKIASIALAMLDAEIDPTGVRSIQALMDWFDDGLAEGEADKLAARLRDPSDPLDFPVLNDVVTWLIGETAARPTGPSSE